MKIQIEVTIPDANIKWLMDCFQGAQTVAAAPAETATEAEPTPPTEKPAKSKKAKATEPEAKATEPEASSEPEDVPEPPAKKVSRDEVLKAAEAFLKSGSDGPTKLQKFLKQVGANRVREIAEDKLPEFLALIAVEG